jgi:hypothetical protein
MPVLKSIQTTAYKLLKTKIAGLLTQSRFYQSRNQLDQINAKLESIDPVESFIPSTPIEERSYLSSDIINKKLEGAYIDHLLQLETLRMCYNGLAELNTIYETRIVPAVKEILNMESKINIYRSLTKYRGIFNNIYHDTFNNDTNSTTNDRKLSINKEAGILRMDSYGKVLTRKETCNLKYEIITEGAELIDEGNIDDLLTDDENSRWYLSYIVNGLPKNESYPRINLSNYNGVIVAVRIQLPSIQQISRITLSDFSIASQDILAVLYSDTHNQSLRSLNIRKADISFYQNKNDSSKEMNIYELHNNVPRIINAAEIVILIGQSNYIESENENKFMRTPNTREIIERLNYYAKSRRIELNSIYNRDASSFILEPESIVRKVQEINIPKGARNYFIGLSKLIVENRVYEPYGVYQSKNIKVDGNIVAFGLKATEKNMHSIGNATILYSINFGSKTIPVQPYKTHDYVIDSFFLYPVNRELNIYRGTTNFIPMRSETDRTKLGGILEIFVDGSIAPQPLVDSIRIVKATETGVVLEVTSTILHENSVITMKYIPAQFDHEGIEYEPDKIDILKIFGKPNIDIKFWSARPEVLFFIKDSSNRSVSLIEGSQCNFVEINGMKFLSVAKSIFDTKVDNNDGPRHKVNDPTLLTLMDNGRYYIPEIHVFTPDDESYVIRKSEIPQIMFNGNPTNADNWTTIRTIGTEINGEYEFITLYEYARNLIVIEVDKSFYRIPVSGQYSVDTAGSINNKRLVRIHKSLIEGAERIRFHYVPLFYYEIPGLVVTTNISNHNKYDLFAGTTNGGVILSKPPFLDNEIIASGKWTLNGGTFYNRNQLSIVYEPILVYVGNQKARNITKYRDTEEEEIFSPDEITYVVEGNKVSFNKNITDPIRVHYYTIGDEFSYTIQMFRCDNSRYFLTPELKDITMLVASRK